jgi:hypothetical protein
MNTHIRKPNNFSGFIKKLEDSPFLSSNNYPDIDLLVRKPYGMYHTRQGVSMTLSVICCGGLSGRIIILRF